MVREWHLVLLQDPVCHCLPWQDTFVDPFGFVPATVESVVNFTCRNETYLHPEVATYGHSHHPRTWSAWSIPILHTHLHTLFRRCTRPRTLTLTFLHHRTTLLHLHAQVSVHPHAHRAHIHPAHAGHVHHWI